MAESNKKLHDLILRLFDVGGLKFGKFIMRNNEETPIYIDMRVIWSYPDIVKDVTDLMWDEVQKLSLSFDCICGLPYQGIPLASILSTQHNVPMLLKRKSVKQYGTMNMFEGCVKANQSVLILDDVLMTGGTFVDDIPAFHSAGLTVSSAVVFFDRQQGGKERTKFLHGVNIYSVLDLEVAFQVLLKADKVTEKQVVDSTTYIQSNRFDTAEYGVEVNHSATSTSNHC